MTSQSGACSTAIGRPVGDHLHLRCRCVRRVLLGQLRPDDLNVTNLGDLDALTETWSAMEETSGLSRLRRVNRATCCGRWPGHGHAFHSKTYLFGEQHGGVLLVGSGTPTCVASAAATSSSRRFAPTNRQVRHHSGMARTG